MDATKLIYLGTLPTPVQDTFAQKVNNVSYMLGINPNWLMQLMHAESGINPKAQNRQGADKHLVAVGLIQFTLGCGVKDWGYTLEQIAQLGYVDQMPLVYRFFKPFTGRIHSYYDLYLINFFPAAIGKPDSFVFETHTISAAKIALQNPAIWKDRSRNYITVADFKNYVLRSVPPALRSQVFDTGAVAAAEAQQLTSGLPTETAIEARAAAGDNTIATA